MAQRSCVFQLNEERRGSMKPPYRSVESMLALIDGPNGRACEKMLAENRKLFQTVPGSSHNHQAWPGGYYDHMQEAMNLASDLYVMYSARRPLPFTLSDALLVLFLHDTEKPWKYELGEDGLLRYKRDFDSKEKAQAFREAKFAEYGIALTPEQANGLRYVEGEIGDSSPRERRMGPLASLCHQADNASARMWPEYPLEQDDPWEGAGRFRDT